MSTPRGSPLLRVVAVVAIAGAAWWALKPLPEPDLSVPSIALVGPEPPRVDQIAALDVSAFSTPLWVAPPAAPPPPAPPPPVPPLKLQLIAIVSEPSAAAGQVS